MVMVENYSKFSVTDTTLSFHIFSPCSVCKNIAVDVYTSCCLCVRVYRIEKHTLTPTKYMFPNFETLHWFVAPHILDTLRGTVHLLYC